MPSPFLPLGLLNLLLIFETVKAGWTYKEGRKQKTETGTNKINWDCKTNSNIEKCKPTATYS
jgi:hypothetical protein